MLTGRKLQQNESIQRRAETLFEQQRQETFRRTDRLFARLMVFQWVAGIVIALWISPLSWSGTQSQLHLHVWLATFLGAAITFFPVFATRRWPGSALTRHSVAVGQALTSILLIHLTGGRLETHFHIFGSLVILSFYRDWRVLVPATLIIGLDHFIRGIYWPFSAYGVLTASPWRSIEHSAWVLFEDIFLVISCLRSVREMKAIARRTAEVESSEERFRQLAEHIQEVFWVFDPRTDEIIYVSPAWEQVWGTPATELAAGPAAWLNSIHPEDRPRITERRQTGLAEGRFMEQYRIVRPDGSIRWIRDRAFPVRDESGAIYRLVGIAEDVTSQHEAEESLRLKSTLLQAQSESTVDGILVVSHNGSILSHNRRFLELFGLPADVTNTPDADALAAVLGRVASPEAFLARVHYLYEHPDERGRDQILLVNGKVLDRYTTPIKAADGYHYGRIWFFRDITDQELTLSDLQKAKEESERANRAKSEFLSRMSHELRTPLNAILGFGQILEIEPLDPRQHQSVKHILKGGRHLLTLINEVLEISKIESGGLELSLEPIEVKPLLQETCDLIRPLAHQRRISIAVTEMPSSVAACFALADLQRMKQVVLNIVSNAIKYNRDGGAVAITSEYVAEWASPKGTVAPLGSSPAGIRISVRDTGHGLSEEQRRKLFTPFERLGAERGDIEGSGIGLALSLRLMEAMAGRIVVESTPGVGSCFAIEFPAAEPPPGYVPVGREPAHAAAEVPYERALLVAGRRRTVLQIEDNLANQQVIERVLERRPDTRLLSAMQGRIGIELAREHRPDLILLDLHLPDLPGAEVLTRLRSDASTRHIPVVVISADATEHQIQRLQAMGATEYLTKPFDLSRLMGAIDRVFTTNSAPPADIAAN